MLAALLLVSFSLKARSQPGRSSSLISEAVSLLAAPPVFAAPFAGPASPELVGAGATGRTAGVGWVATSVSVPPRPLRPAAAGTGAGVLASAAIATAAGSLTAIASGAASLSCTAVAAGAELLAAIGSLAAVSGSA